MRVLITGATGFLGSHLAELLVEEGHGVRALVRASSDTALLERLGVELAEASLEEGRGLFDAVDGVDAIVHGAGLVKARSVEEFRRVNVGGTSHLLEAARSVDGLRRFVYVSSLAAHGFSDDGRPRAVDAEPRPVTHYGRSKLEGERLVLAAKEELPVSVIRPPAIYGPRDAEMFNFFKMVATRVQAFLGSPDNTLSLIWAPDCARAIRDMLVKEHPTGSVYFVEDGRVYTQSEFADIVARALDVRGLKLSVPIALVRLAAVGSELYGKARNRAVMLTRDKVNELEQPYLVCSSEAIERDLGWRAEVQLEEGARRAVEWYREHGWL